ISRRTLRGLRQLSLWLLCVGAALLAPASAAAVPSAACNNRVNNTPGRLIPCITKADLWAHMQNLQAIADANPGPDGHPSRNAGEPGYLASANYVANVMKAAGYTVTTQQYTVPYSAFVGPQSFSEVSPTAQSFTLVDDWNPGTSNGDLTGAQIMPAG